LAEQHFTFYEKAKNRVDSWIGSKGTLFFKHAICMLAERLEVAYLAMDNTLDKVHGASL